jgi:hypothetical protein
MERTLSEDDTDGFAIERNLTLFLTGADVPPLLLILKSFISNTHHSTYIQNFAESMTYPRPLRLTNLQPPLPSPFLSSLITITSSSSSSSHAISATQTLMIAI